MNWLSLGRLLPIRANTLRSLSSKVAPQNEGSEVVGAQHGMYLEVEAHEIQGNGCLSSWLTGVLATKLQIQ